MSTTPQDPFRTLDRTFDRLFGDPMRGQSGSSVMPMDLFRSGETFVAHIDLPGVDPKSIDIDVEDRTLTVRAERSAPEADNAQWLSRERPSGTFARQLSLGRGLALDRIEADYRDGVLTLTIPVAEEAKPRRISVSHGGSSQSGSSQSESSHAIGSPYRRIHAYRRLDRPGLPLLPRGAPPPRARRGAVQGRSRRGRGA